MKVGIVTRHNSLNAGAILQAFALQTCLEDMGHKVEFVDIDRPKRCSWCNYVAKSPSVMFHKWIDNFNAFRYGQRTDWNKCLHKSESHYGAYEELASAPPMCDIYVAGSDQIWNFLHSLDPLYLLDFAPKGKKRIAYAASMGQCIVPTELHKSLAGYLSKFYAISLREDNAVAFVNNLMGKEVACKTIDPTLLNDQAHYNSICEPVIVGKPFVASYILSLLDRDQCRNIVKWANQSNFTIINLRNPSTCIRLAHATNKIVTPYQWLGYIREAQMVISGSFHATVFALIYHKPFVVVLPHVLKAQGGNARIQSLLEPLGLQQRMIYENDVTVLEAIFRQEIDWERVDNIIGSMRRQSIDFLKANII